VTDISASRQIDAIIASVSGWRGERLSQLRQLITQADRAIVEEVKWKKPSNPAGVPVWSRDGIICVGEALKNAVRLTFPHGAQLIDPKQLFNARLTGTSTRAVDFVETAAVDAAALTELVREAARLNATRLANR
jgi:hypothetical protein